MIRLNNKGITIVEILVCFLLVTFITTALYASVSSFSNKRSIESVKADLLQYRNDIDKMIEDDLIYKGLTNAVVTEPIKDPNKTKYVVKLSFRDGTTKELVIFSQRAGEYGSNIEKEEVTDEASCTGYNDDFYIGYGTTQTTDDYIRYDLPDVGSSENEDCPTNPAKTTFEKIYDLRFNSITVSNADNVLFIYINFYHPELGNDYSINIVAPINYFA